MPRKSLIYTTEYPYHIVARSNNKEWFYLPTEDCWTIFSKLLVCISDRFHFKIHAFILMKNHYHLIGSASEQYPLYKVMEWFQRSANRIINDKAGRINHLFGGPYKGSLITEESYYLHALRYLYQNPLKLGVAERVEEYEFSTLRNSIIPVQRPTSDIDCLVEKEYDRFLLQMNEPYTDLQRLVIARAIRKTEFRIPFRQR